MDESARMHERTAAFDLGSRVAHLSDRVRAGRVAVDRVELASALGDETATAVLGARTRLAAPEDPLAWGLHVFRGWGAEAAARAALAAVRHALPLAWTPDGEPDRSAVMAALDQLEAWLEAPARTRGPPPQRGFSIAFPDIQGPAAVQQALLAARGLPWSAALALEAACRSSTWPAVRRCAERALIEWALRDARPRPGAAGLHAAGRADDAGLSLATLAGNDEALALVGGAPGTSTSFEAWLEAIADHGIRPAAVALTAVTVDLLPFVDADCGVANTAVRDMLRTIDEWLPDGEPELFPGYDGSGADYVYAAARAIRRPPAMRAHLRSSTRSAVDRLTRATEPHPAPCATPTEATQRLRRVMSEALIAWALPWW